jgi:hypothetical protein
MVSPHLIDTNLELLVITRSVVGSKIYSAKVSAQSPQTISNDTRFSPNDTFMFA